MSRAMVFALQLFIVVIAVLLGAEMASRISIIDRKSTRLNSSHLVISYAVFCSGLHLVLHSFPTRRSSDLSSFQFPDWVGTPDGAEAYKVNRFWQPLP